MPLSSPGSAGRPLVLGSTSAYRRQLLARLHLPVTVGSTNPPHIHLMAPARELQCYGFGPFVRPFAADAGKAMIAAEWAEWQRRSRSSDGAVE